MARAGRKTGLLTSIFQRGAAADAADDVLELVVVEGPDAGARFALDRPEIQLGRGEANGVDILLSDPSVSAQHAVFDIERQRVTLRHLPTATNPTLVNGRPIKSRQVKAGDEIVVGLVVMQLRSRRAAAGDDAPPPEAVAPTRVLDRPRAAPEPGPPPEATPTTMLGPRPEPSPPPEVTPTTVLGPRPQTLPEDDPGRTRIAAPAAEAPEPPRGSGRLMLTAGAPELEGRRFELDARRTGIGRSDDCDVALPIPSVSRHHAALVWEGSELFLVHESKTNPTYVNGVRVEDRTRLAHGDQIQLVEGVTFYLMIDPPGEESGSQTQPDFGPPPEPEAATRIAEGGLVAGEPPGTVVLDRDGQDRSV